MGTLAKYISAKGAIAAVEVLAILPKDGALPPSGYAYLT